MTKKDLTGKELGELMSWAFEGDDCPVWLEVWAYDHYAGEIPYGTLTGDTGTVDEWLSDRVQWIIDHFELEDPNENKRKTL